MLVKTMGEMMLINTFIYEVVLFHFEKSVEKMR